MSNPINRSNSTAVPLDSLELECKLEMVELINEINISITKATKLDDVLRVACKSLGRVLRCDRVSILVRDSRNDDAMLTQGEYLRGHYPAQLNLLVPIASNPHLKALIEQPEHVLAFQDFRQFPGLSPDLLAIIETLQIQSMMAAATSYRGDVNGVVGIHQCDHKREWSPWEQQLLQGVSRQLGIAIGQAKLYEATRNAALQESLMRRVSDRIRSSHDLNEILQTAVDGAQTLIQSDRVVIYKFQSGWKGRVVVENVATPWTSVLGDIGADDCFAGKYAELYRNGRVRAIDDIETDPKLDVCHVNFLRSLQVRANLIVPITLNLASEMGYSITPEVSEVSGGGAKERLWGLLIAHQCDRPRRWQNRDIQLLSQLSGQIAIALRQIELDARIKSQARRERMLRHTIAQIRGSFDLMAILQTAATSIRELLGSSRVTVYRFRDDLDGDVVVESVARKSWSILDRNIRDNCFSFTSAQNYLTGSVRSINNIFEAPQLDDCHRHFLIDLEVKAYAIAPIVIRPRPHADDRPTHSDPDEHLLQLNGEELQLWGLAIVHECVNPRHWQDEDLSLLRQVSDQMSIAIQQTTLYDRARARARRERALRQSIAQIRSSLDLPASLQAATDSVLSVLEADRVTVYQFDDRWDGRVVVESVSRSQWSVLNQDVSDNCFKQDYAQLYRDGRVRTICDIHTDSVLDDCHRAFLEGLPTRASAIVGVVVNVNRDGEQAEDLKRAWLWGLLIVHQCETPRRWTQGETDMLRQIADQVAIAIQQTTLYNRTRSQAEELQETLDQLRSTQEKLLRSEKLSSLGKMAGGVAHEINNANNFIFANLHHARSYVEDLITALDAVDGDQIEEVKDEIDFPYIQEDFPKLLASIESGSERIKNIVDALQQFNNSDRTELQLIRLSDCLEGCLNDRRSRLSQIRVTKAFEPLPCLECNPAQLERALGSILDNAIDAVEAIGSIGSIGENKANQARSDSDVALMDAIDRTNPADRTGEITITLSDHDDWIELTITDNGVGIPESVRPRMFDPFFTTKDVGGGTGLGLTTAYQILVEGHGGKIDVDTGLGRGTTIMVSLPVSQG